MRYKSTSDLCISAYISTRLWIVSRSYSGITRKTGRCVCLYSRAVLVLMIILQTQATLILASRLSTTPETLLNILPLLMQELVGFFMIEAHVLRTMPDFRSQRDVDELWDEMCRRIVEVTGQGLKGCGQPHVFLESKTNVLLFVQTLEVSESVGRGRGLIKQGYGYNITELNGLLITLFERYSKLLLRKFSADFDEASHMLAWRQIADLWMQIVSNDDNQPMWVNDQDEFDQVSGVCWLATGEAESLAM